MPTGEEWGWASLVTALTLIIGALVTAYIKLRQQRAVEAKEAAEIEVQLEKMKLDKSLAERAADLKEDEQIERGFKYLFKKQDGRITDLEEIQRSLQDQLTHCKEDHARCEQNVAHLKDRCDFLENIIDEVRKRDN